MTVSAFVTGTGTSVGKTFVAAGLIRCLRKRNKPVEALKPLVSGFDPADPKGSDPALLLEALGRMAGEADIRLIAPWRFLAPLSADMAAQAEGRAIDFGAIVDFCAAAAEAARGTLLIEGIGGIMAPVGQRHTVLDLAVALKLPLILVAGSYLGTLSHTLCAQEVIRHHALDLLAIVISESEGSSVPLDATLASLAHFTHAPLLGLRRHGSALENDAVFERLADLLSASASS